LPVLGDQYGLVLERGELTLGFDPSTGAFSVSYYDHRFPIDPRDYPLVLDAACATLHESAAAALSTLTSAARHLPARDELETHHKEQRARDIAIHKRELVRLCAEHEAVSHAIRNATLAINGTPGERASFERLHALLERQAYRLASWRVAADEINYRRFFDINDLAALRMEDERVFEATHQLVLKLCAEGKVDGLRIDHPDGLYDPEQYFNRLQQRYAQVAGVDAAPGTDGRPPRPLYVVIEKIAASHEKIPESWAVYGTSGYRFATVVNNVLVDCTAGDEMERIYRSFARTAQDYATCAYEGKRAIMAAALASALTMLATELTRIALMDRRTRDYTLNNLRRALAEVVACMPVYRTYIIDTPSAQDRRYIEWAVAQARRRTGAADTSVFDFVRRMLLAEAPEDASDELRSRVRTFAMKMQQFTAPVMAKGVEDTAFYRYHRLISLNDVGGDPAQFGIPVSAFHGATAERAAHRPHTMLATSTHDNKRSEDVRTRIDVLSEMPGAWRAWLRRWQRINRSKTVEVDGVKAPSANDEYLLYQTLLGTFDNQDAEPDAWAAYCARIQAYMQKAAREAKERTSWINPNEAYEAAVANFVSRVLSPSGRNLFLKDLREHSRTLAWFGMLNSLSLVLLKLTSPGVPDIYQGNETIDLSLVDPDNRRAVNYAQRARMLDTLEERAASPRLDHAVKAFAAHGLDGRAKLWLTWRALMLRRKQPDLFRLGNYLPLQVKGERAEHVIAYMRSHRGRIAIIIAGRLWLKLGVAAGTPPLGREVWGDTVIESGAHTRELTNVLTGESVSIEDGRIELNAAFKSFPAALLVG
ncbi:MAG TPA: malto-oligosyltrehalose synthase, partial [Burkholderiales bacterium]|nr:malto-oligosyltrehalose synthase [Burkholderiales bacterium]